ncbi:MAG: GntG family PLP-dependent aldolase [Polyangiales bacterium]
MIDLRSDTVTRPTTAMRQAMANADVGDDVYGEDPSVRALEERSAELLGKEAAIFVPSGTMANQIALMLHCRPGDEVIVGRGAHLYYYEGGAGGAFAGVQFVEVGTTGLFTAADATLAIKPEAYWLPRTRAISVENTHNRAGGRVFPSADIDALADLAVSHGFAVHMDGARIWNASAKLGLPAAEVARRADTVSACFSKGLGAPVGSALAGSRAHIAHARRLRRMLGGAMRQAGILAAGALYALDHHRERLVDDHRNARRLAEVLANSPGIQLDLASVETNLVIFDLVDAVGDDYVARAREQGVLVSAIGPRRIRAVTHLGVEPAEIEEAARVLASNGRSTKR